MTDIQLFRYMQEATKRGEFIRINKAEALDILRLVAEWLDTRGHTSAATVLRDEARNS